MKRGLALALIQTLLAAGVAGRYYYERATLPRVWTRALPVDPDLPIRGRYVRIFAEVHAEPPLADETSRVGISALDGKLVASPGAGRLGVMRTRNGEWALREPLAFFITEHAADPSIRQPGEELWVEVSVPRRGLPRPVQLGVKREGVLRPIPN